MNTYLKGKRCPKCGGNSISDRYVAKGDRIGLAPLCWDLINRCCRNCSYEWQEKALDAEEI